MMASATDLAQADSALPPAHLKAGPTVADADPLDFALLNDFQRGFPLVAEPWAQLAAQLGCDAGEVLARLERLRDAGKVSRVGPVFAPNRIGASTLAAMAVPVGELPRVAAIVSAFAGVNHNYRREHHLNMWFVLATETPEGIAQAIARIEAATGLPVFAFPKLREFFVDMRLKA